MYIKTIFAFTLVRTYPPEAPCDSFTGLCVANDIDIVLRPNWRFFFYVWKRVLVKGEFRDTVFIVPLNRIIGNIDRFF